MNLQTWEIKLNVEDISLSSPWQLAYSFFPWQLGLIWGQQTLWLAQSSTVVTLHNQVPVTDSKPFDKHLMLCD